MSTAKLPDSPEEYLLPGWDKNPPERTLRDLLDACQHVDLQRDKSHAGLVLCWDLAIKQWPCTTEIRVKSALPDGRLTSKCVTELAEQLASDRGQDVRDLLESPVHEIDEFLSPTAEHTPVPIDYVESVRQAFDELGECMEDTSRTLGLSRLGLNSKRVTLDKERDMKLAFQSLLSLTRAGERHLIRTPGLEYAVDIPWLCSVALFGIQAYQRWHIRAISRHLGWYTESDHDIDRLFAFLSRSYPTEPLDSWRTRDRSQILACVREASPLALAVGAASKRVNPIPPRNKRRPSVRNGRKRRHKSSRHSKSPASMMGAGEAMRATADDFRIAELDKETPAIDGTWFKTAEIAGEKSEGVSVDDLKRYRNKMNQRGRTNDGMFVIDLDGRRIRRKRLNGDCWYWPATLTGKLKSSKPGKPKDI